MGRELTQKGKMLNSLAIFSRGHQRMLRCQTLSIACVIVSTSSCASASQLRNEREKSAVLSQNMRSNVEITWTHSHGARKQIQCCFAKRKMHDTYETCRNSQVKLKTNQLTKNVCATFDILFLLLHLALVWSGLVALRSWNKCLNSVWCHISGISFVSFHVCRFNFAIIAKYSLFHLCGAPQALLYHRIHYIHVIGNLYLQQLNSTLQAISEFLVVI